MKNVTLPKLLLLLKVYLEWGFPLLSNTFKYLQSRELQYVVVTICQIEFKNNLFGDLTVPFVWNVL
jgi:hypothetical protein